jgi:hypothetical protein
MPGATKFPVQKPCRRRRAATAVPASKKAAGCTLRQRSSLQMLLRSPEPLVSPLGSTQGICAPLIIQICQLQLPPLRSGTHMISNKTAGIRQHTLEYLPQRLAADHVCSCVYIGVRSSCSSATAPSTERHHQHFSTAPPHSSTAYAEHLRRASTALTSLPTRAIRCRCADAGWAEAEGCRSESGLFTKGSARLESAHWRGGGCRGFSTQGTAKAASPIDNGRTHRCSNSSSQSIHSSRAQTQV